MWCEAVADAKSVLPGWLCFAHVVSASDIVKAALHSNGAAQGVACVGV